MKSKNDIFYSVRSSGQFDPDTIFCEKFFALIYIYIYTKSKIFYCIFMHFRQF